jgi:ABC-2 type transport system ATP-binding protein
VIRQHIFEVPPSRRTVPAHQPVLDNVADGLLYAGGGPGPAPARRRPRHRERPGRARRVHGQEMTGSTAGTSWGVGQDPEFASAGRSETLVAACTLGGMNSAIALEGVVKRYGELAAVDGISLEVPRGQRVALLGANGAGKTTTVGLLMAMLRPDIGRVAVAGGLPQAAVRAGRIAAMLQDCGPMPGARAGELVALARGMYPAPLGVEEALGLAGLRDLAGRRVERLSGGQAQRLKFALVAVANPEILLLDEPTRALDVHARQVFWAAVRRWAAAGHTVLFATHYLEEVDENADRVVVLARGRVVADASPRQIRAASGGCVVRFRIPHGAALPALPGSVTREGCWVTVRTNDSDRTVRCLAAGSVAWSDLRVTQPSLGDSFLALTDRQATSDLDTEEAAVR